jgi:hypothetical protein
MSTIADNGIVRVSRRVSSCVRIRCRVGVQARENAAVFDMPRLLENCMLRTTRIAVHCEQNRYCRLCRSRDSSRFLDLLCCNLHDREFMDVQSTKCGAGEHAVGTTSSPLGCPCSQVKFECG